eukprot:TRINITY_DN9172_c0_g1_i1.p1 TRINITY_DN9172_c0_g1~~TRINITY_DN9172_c0_g1_i1.p1  ORF type:complete len:328 (+),score=49.43 TRINITY_DN9172_c0_g1_i1:240-1223(+)
MQDLIRYQNTVLDTRFPDINDSSLLCKTFSSQGSQSSQAESSWDAFDPKEDQEPFPQGSQTNESPHIPVMIAKIPSFTSHDDSFTHFGITSGCSSRLQTNLFPSEEPHQISPMDLNPDLNYIIKQEPIKDEPLDDFPPPFLAALRAQIDSRLLEEDAFHDDEKFSASASTDDEKQSEDFKISTEIIKAAAENSLRRPKNSRIRKSRQMPPPPKVATSRLKPYKRAVFGAEIAAELKPQLKLLDLGEVTNADVIQHMSERFPKYAKHGEFTSSWVTKARYGHILSTITGRSPTKLREGRMIRAKPPNTNSKTREITDDLFLTIFDTLH